MKIAVYIIVFISISIQVRAEKSCNRFDVYQGGLNSGIKSGSVKIKNDHRSYFGPTRDQDSVGWCYGYAAADLLEQWLKRKGEIPKSSTNVVSAMALGIEGQKDKWKNGAFTSYNTAKKLLAPVIIQKTKERKVLAKERTKLIFQKRGLRLQYEKDHPKFKKREKLRIKLRDLIILDSVRQNKQNQNWKSLGFANDEEFKRQYSLVASEIKLISKEIHQESRRLANLDPNSLKLEKQIKNLFKPIRNIEETLADLFERSRPPKDIVPESGLGVEAIEAAFPRICYEQELSSRDNNFADIFEQNRALFQGNSFFGSTLKDALEHLALTRHSADCLTYDLIKDIFPGLKINTLNDLVSILDQLDHDSDLFSELLTKSCVKKIIPKPNLNYKNISRIIPIGENESLLHQIDNALENEGVATIGFRAQIFDRHNLLSKEEDDHEAVIAGNLEICGKKYYVVRSSWGQASCRAKERSYQSKSLEDQESFSEQEIKCQKMASARARKDFPNCKHDKCWEELNSFMNNEEEKCKKTNRKKFQKKVDFPFFCDEQGNFIVTKEHLKKGLFSVTTIDN